MSRKSIHKTVQSLKSDIAGGVMIREFCTIRSSSLGFFCQVYERVSIKKSKIGGKSDINAGTYIENANIGKNVQIGPNCVIAGVTHEFSLKKGISHQDAFKEIIIKDGAWIGAGAIILPGVTIGQGAIVGAGAIVKADVPDGYVYVGTPLGNKLEIMK